MSKPSDDDEYPDRPNRFLGPESTWRHHTRDERAIAKSLQALQARNLSAHLYNAHALKKRNNFVPPNTWTAWPLTAAEVPRDDVLTRFGNEAFRTLPGPRPSGPLEDCIMAVTTKMARECWGRRRWEHVSKKSAVTKVEGVDQPNLVQEEDVTSSPESSVPDQNMYSSQAFDALAEDHSSPESPTSNSDENEAKLETKPVPLADDDRARQLLLPSIRNIITKADDLLLGLQKARQAYAVKNKSSDDEGSGAADTDATTSKSRSRSRRPTKRTRISSVETADSDASAISTSSTKRRNKTRIREVNLRDWSDVLGMAALTGWDPAVLERAGKRCSRLFGEEMLFRTFYEGSSEQGQGEKSYFVEQLASGQEPAHSSDEEGGEEEGDVKIYPAPRAKRRIQDSNDGGPSIRCPVLTCEYHRKGFGRANNMYNHVRKHHSEINVDELKKLEAERRGERRGRWSGEKRHRNPYERSQSRQS